MTPEFSHSSGRTHYLLFLLITVINATITMYAEDTKPPSNRLQDFITNPTEIERIIVREQTLYVPVAPDPKVKISPQITNEIQLYHGAWKSNAFFLTQHYSLKDMGAKLGELRGNVGRLFSGRVKDKSWYIVNTNIYSRTTQEDPGFTNPIQTTALLAERSLTLYLTFGLANTRPRSIVWGSNNEFVADFANAQKPLHGSLLLSNGVPIKMSVSNAVGSLLHISEYSYNSTNKLPAVVTVYSVNNGQLFPEFKYELLALVQATTPLDDDFFAPEQFVDPKYLGQSIYTNGALFDVVSNQLVRLQTDEERASRAVVGGKSQTPKRLIALLLFVVFTVAFYYFARSSSQNKH